MNVTGPLNMTCTLEADYLQDSAFTPAVYVLGILDLKAQVTSGAWPVVGMLSGGNASAQPGQGSQMVMNCLKCFQPWWDAVWQSSSFLSFSPPLVHFMCIFCNLFGPPDAYFALNVLCDSRGPLHPPAASASYFVSSPTVSYGGERVIAAADRLQQLAWGPNSSGPVWACPPVADGDRVVLVCDLGAQGVQFRPDLDRAGGRSSNTACGGWPEKVWWLAFPKIGH